MKARLVRIGNSRGVRLPKPLIEEAGLTEDVELQVQEGQIIISRVSHVCEGVGSSGREACNQPVPFGSNLYALPVSTLWRGGEMHYKNRRDMT